MSYIRDIGYSLKDIQLPTKSKKQKQLNLFPKRNPYYSAKTFADKYKLSVIFVLKLFKKYGEKAVLSTSSFLADYPLKTDSYTGILVWKLQQKNAK